MHSIITALVFALALYCTALTAFNTVAAIHKELLDKAARKQSDLLAALSWGLFYYLTR